MLLEKDKAYIESLAQNLSLEDINELNNIISRQKNNYFSNIISRLETLKAERRRITEDMSSIKVELENEARRLKLAGNIKQSREYYDIINDADNSSFVNNSIELIHDNPFLKDLCIGDTVSFGQFPQGIDKSILAPILWLVLDVEGGKALLLSKYCLDSIPYNEEKSSVTWENSSINKWLNNEFIKSFSNEEQSLIVSKDKELVTLLSLEENDKYLKGENSRSCYGTIHALKTANHFIDSTAVSYWVKGDVSDPAHASVITPLGSVCSNKAVNDTSISIRPALWVRFK